jgi:hypothetical protein
MGRTRDARVESTYNAPDCALEFQTDSLRVDVAAGGDFQRAFNGAHIVYRGDDKLGRSDQASLDFVMVDERPAWGFYQAISITIPWSVADCRITLIEGLFEDGCRTLYCIHKLDTPAEVEEQDSMRGMPKGFLKTSQVLIGAWRAHATGHVDPRQAVRP